MNFAVSHGTNSAASNPAPVQASATTKVDNKTPKSPPGVGPDPSKEPKVEEALNARLLATLKAHEGEPLQAQRQVFLEPPYDVLPVAKFLSGVTEPLPAPLADMAAKYLDGEPLARQWAVKYAQMEIASYRSSGYWPSDTEQAQHFQELIDYAVPVYARSIYLQHGGKR